jgi:hypothetical protein
MREMDRIARLLEQTVEGHPYYGPSVLRALTAARSWRAHRASGQPTRCALHISFKSAGYAT